MEQWKVVKGFENYLVSSLGNVKTINGKLKKVVYDSKNDYGYVELWKNNKGKKFRIHRLVAETFIPNPKNLPVINHIDGNKLNNVVENLEWCTHQENTKHAMQNGLIKPPPRSYHHPYCKLNKEQIDYIKKVYIPYDKEYGSRALARKFNVTHFTILRAYNYKE